MKEIINLIITIRCKLFVKEIFTKNPIHFSINKHNTKIENFVFLLLSLSLYIVLTIVDCNAQNSESTFCNPLNLNYRFMTDLPSRREAADPVILLFKDQYYLFASKSGGYWFSNDLLK